MLSLQRSIGNGAVAKLMGLPSASPAPPVGDLVRRRGSVLQRKSYPRTTDAGTALKLNKADIYADLERFAELLNDAVTIGWQQATQDPTNATYAALDGYLGRWAEQWALYADPSTSSQAKTVIRPLVPAMCGYAIESLATKMFLKDRKQWTGERSGLVFDVVMQDPHGNTRPDVVLKSGGEEYAWYDITADTTTSRNHIDKKVGAGWKTRPYIAEICYPKVDADEVVRLSGAWVLAGKPAIAGVDPKMIANYWLERGRYEVLMEYMKHLLKPCFDLAREAASSDSDRRFNVRSVLALAAEGVDLSGLTDVKSVRAAIQKADSDHMPTPKEAAAIVTFVTGTGHMNWGFRKAGDRYSGLVSMFGTPVRAPLGIGWLQECAAERNVVIDDSQAIAHIRANYDEGLKALQAVKMA